MPTTLIYETPRSREGSEQYAGAALTREYCVLYEPEFTAAVSLVELTADLTFRGLDRKEITWRSLGAPDLWLFTVQYGSSAEAGALRPDQFNFKLAAASVHITQSKETPYRLSPGDGVPASGTNMTVFTASPAIVIPDGYAPGSGDVGASVVVTGGEGWTPGTYLITGFSTGVFNLDSAPAIAGATGGIWHLSGTAPDCRGAIGVALDTVQGCDIVVPGCELTFSQNVASMTDDFIRLLRSMIGKTNKYTFRGYPPGTMLYLGPEPTSPAGTLPAGQPFTFWNLAHSFRYEPDVTDFFVGAIFVPRKGGHEYLWCRYATIANGNSLIQQPIAVYIERVYDSAGFGLLGLDF